MSFPASSTPDVFELNLNTWPGPLWVGVVFGRWGLRRVILEASRCAVVDRLSAFESCEGATETEGGELLERFGAYCARRADALEGVAVDLSGVTGFRRDVLSCVREIAFGHTRSYGEVAEAIGRPKAVRAVGGALAANPAILVIPCHRVVCSDGGPGGFSAVGGVGLKQALLAHERVGRGQC